MVDDAGELPTLTFTRSLGIAFECTKLTLHSATFGRRVLLRGVTLA